MFYVKISFLDKLMIKHAVSRILLMTYSAVFHSFIF